MNRLSILNDANKAELYDFTNLYELKNACYNLDIQKIIQYANEAEADEVISLLLVLEGHKRKEFIDGVDIDKLADTSEDLHARELMLLLDELSERRRELLMRKLSDNALYRLSSVKKHLMKKSSGFI
ncbi:MAG: hypothetical protein LAT84_05890 [Balneolia bacterium]|nr:hypothetical protein [Balneolia bacterium]